MQGCRSMWIALACAASCLFGCTTVRAPSSPTAQASYAQGERLLRDRQYATAGHVFEDLATRAAPEARDPLLLRAAHAWLRAEDLQRGTSILRQIGEHVPVADL